MDSVSAQVIAFRIGERITLTIVVLLVALVVMVGFWRTVQRVKVDDGGKLGVAASFVLSTPVFVLMTIVGYAWVSLAHPISIGAPASALQGARVETVFAANRPGVGGFTGASCFDAPTLADPGHARHNATEQIRTLNCLASGQNLSGPPDDHLRQVKFLLMAPLWDEAWGDRQDFEKWVRGETVAEPDAEARAVFDAKRSGC